MWVDNIGQLAMTGKRNEFSGKKKNIYIELTDISEGMISDARRNIKKATESWKERDIDVSFRFRVASCEKTGAKDESYDLVIANHVLFYCKNVNKALDDCEGVKAWRSACVQYIWQQAYAGDKPPCVGIR